jgi:integrase/recombinase XerD
MAYLLAIRPFLMWCEARGLRDLRDIKPIVVAAYIEQHPGSPPTVKQHLAAIRLLLDWLVT